MNNKQFLGNGYLLLKKINSMGNRFAEWCTGLLFDRMVRRIVSCPKERQFRFASFLLKEGRTEPAVSLFADLARQGHVKSQKKLQEMAMIDSLGQQAILKQEKNENNNK